MSRLTRQFTPQETLYLALNPLTYEFTKPLVSLVRSPRCVTPTMTRPNKPITTN